MAAIVLALVGLTAGASTGALAGPAGPNGSFIDGTIQSAMRTARVPGALVAVTVPGGSYERAYGVADLASHAPMRASLHVRVSALTDTFTATAILEQVARRRISLSDRASRWVRGGGRATVAQLLGRHSPPARLLLAAILKIAAGRSADTVISHDVIARAGLRATSFPKGTGIPRPYAHAYCTQSRRRDCTSVSPSSASAQGALVSTLDDLQKWGRTMTTGTLLPARLRPAMLAALGRYGDWRGLSGEALGFSVATLYEPSTGAEITIVTNSGWTSAYRLFTAIAGHLYLSVGPSIQPEAPSIQSAPQISGPARPGNQLSATTGTWNGTTPFRFAYQWQRCTVTGAGCQAIGGATSAQYVLSNADVGSRLRVAVTAGNAAGSASAPSTPTDVIGAGRDPVIVAVGDIACPQSDTTNPCVEAKTAALARAQNPDDVLVLGDNQYNSGLYSEFTTGPKSYDQTWGTFNPIVHPIPGNHEYVASQTADGYFQYFGPRAGADYNTSRTGDYSFNLATWHLVALNSNCGDNQSPSCQDTVEGNTTAAQNAWVQNDMASDSSACTLAFWHHPLFTDGYVPASPNMSPLWSQLYGAHADVVLNGHDHLFERFAQLDPAGNQTPGGIREIVAGTGGEIMDGPPVARDPRLQASDANDFGVLVMTLHPTSYDWKFLSIGTDGTSPPTVVDSGTSSCHRPGGAGAGAARDVTAPDLARLSGPPLVFRVRPLHRSLSAVLDGGLPVEVYSSHASDVDVTVWLRRSGRLQRIGTFRETESEIPYRHSRIVLRLPRAALRRSHEATLLLQFSAADSATHRVVLRRTVRLTNR